MFQVSSSLASLIEEVVAIFTISERSVIGKKLSTYLLSFSTFTYFFLLDFFPLSPLLCAFFYVSFYAPPLSVKSNGLLCWYDISGLCVSMMLLSIHIMLLCPLSFPVHSAFGLGFFPNRPASLLLNLRPLYLQYYLNCACFIQFSCAFFSSCFLLSIKAHIVCDIAFQICMTGCAYLYFMHTLALHCK